MTKTIVHHVRNSDVAAPKNKLDFLTFPSERLVPCTLATTDDGITLTFDATGLESASTLLSASTMDKLRFLVNCARLESLRAEYSFNISPDNLMVDINLIPFIVGRDMAIDESNSFINDYKDLIGCFLLPRYTYDDFHQGGKDLHKKSKLTQTIANMESVEEIKNHLLAEYHDLTTLTHQTSKLVNKNASRAVRIAIPIMVLALGVMGYFFVTALFIDIPHNDRVIAANEAYIASNPLAVQQALRGVAVNTLTHETRLILSRSYVATEPISMMQREHILMGMTSMADTYIFDFWIHLGRLEFDEAIEIAQRFGENELLLFAFTRMESVVIADPNMPGGEKVEMLAYIERRIEALQRERETVEVNNETQD
ncbi:MAG: hypothetical protein FWC71_11950 [Defluviitaleaceae bacterium]|nr:hypothetical protein [Defluviitaleaceae bacterium]